MELSNFIELKEKDKKKVVLHAGVLVAKRKIDGYFIFLFQLGLFYVEVFCNLDSKQVEEYHAFETTHCLNPYLESIAIDDLLHS